MICQTNVISKGANDAIPVESLCSQSKKRGDRRQTWQNRARRNQNDQDHWKVSDRKVQVLGYVQRILRRCGRNPLSLNDSSNPNQSRSVKVSHPIQVVDPERYFSPPSLDHSSIDWPKIKFENHGPRRTCTVRSWKKIEPQVSAGLHLAPTSFRSPNEFEAGQNHHQQDLFRYTSCKLQTRFPRPPQSTK